MKQKVSLILVIVLIFSFAVVFSGCETQPIMVESLLKIDTNFAGERTIVFTVPKETDISQLKDLLHSNSPKDETNGYVFSNAGSSDYGNKFEFKIVFTSQAEYIERVSGLLGRDVSVYLAQPDSILTKGTRMEEDFDVSDLMAWAIKIMKENGSTKNLELNYTSNLVNLDGVIFTTDTTVLIKDVTGYEVKNIVIETTNNKDDTYERRFIFSIPENTYEELGQSLKDYFKANTERSAMYAQWTRKGTVYEYEVIYKNIDIEQMTNLTNKILGVTDCSAYYGDKTNSSTPLSEGLIFEERLNLFSFVGTGKEPVPMEYIYYLPTTTTHGEGSVLNKGVWETSGKWTDTSYKLDVNSSVLNVHIPDGIQYNIEGINYYLENKGDNNFIRTADILYSKTGGENGLEYAYNFFKDKDANVIKKENEENLICRIVLEGSAADISKETSRLFGSGNDTEYIRNDNMIDIIFDSEFIDTINIGYMLTVENAKKPIMYTVTSVQDEEIRQLGAKGSGYRNSTYKADDDGSFTVRLESGDSQVQVLSGIYNAAGVALYIVFCSGLVLLTIGIIIRFKVKQRRVDLDHGNTDAPSQTTTFRINELSTLSEVMSKKDKKRR